VEALATSRVRVAGPQRGRKGVVRTEEGEKSVAVSVCSTSGGHSLWLPSVPSHTPCWAGWKGWGGGDAMGRRREALELEQVWLVRLVDAKDAIIAVEMLFFYSGVCIEML
jgi:hypothetical protein